MKKSKKALESTTLLSPSKKRVLPVQGTNCSYCIILFLLLSVNLISVSFIPVDYGNVQMQERGTDIHYHTNTVDQLWYGTNRWAVKFDIQRYTTATDTLVLQEIKVYFPNDNGSFSVKVYSDRLQPLNNLIYERDEIPLVAGWNSVQLAETDYQSLSLFWVVIEYETNAEDRYMAASRNGGDNSFYWVPEQGQIPAHFANIREYNATSEFLVTASGILAFEGIDLELSSFSFGGTIEPGSVIHPILTITNNSLQRVTDNPRLAIDFSNSTGDPISFRSFAVSIDLEPGESVEKIVENQNVRLSEAYCQYQAVATLEFQPDTFTRNNVIRISFNTFPDKLEKSLLENFIRTEHQPSRGIVNTQASLPVQTTYRINYFFHPNDIPHYHIQSALRRDFYGLEGYPYTKVNGVKTIAGYSSTTYAQTLNTYIAETVPTNTFITLVPRTEEKTIGNDMQLTLKFSLRNLFTYLFPATLNNLRLYAALTEKDVPGYPGNTLIHLYRHPAAVTLGEADRVNFDWGINLQTVPTVSRQFNTNNYSFFEIIYWVQDSATKKIYYIDSISLSSFVDIEDETVSPIQPQIVIHPNPFIGNGEITISNNPLSDRITISEVGIYNIKGQLLKSIRAEDNETIQWNGITDTGVDAPNGIYFLKIDTRRHSNNELYPPIFKKLMIVR